MEKCEIKFSLDAIFKKGDLWTIDPETLIGTPITTEDGKVIGKIVRVDGLYGYGEIEMPLNPTFKPFFEMCINEGDIPSIVS